MKNPPNSVRITSEGLELVELFRFEDDWPSHPNALLTDDQNRFYLDYSEQPDLAPRPVTAEEALEWYVKALPFAKGTTGNIGDLLKVVLAILKKGQAA